MKFIKNLIAIASVTVFASGFAAAQTSSSSAVTPSMNKQSTATGMSADQKRERTAAWKGEKDQLEQKLRAAKVRADYAKILESNGYRISAINADKKDYLEYEVVKGDHSYEVQLDFNNGAAMATKVDVSANMWRADATKRMLKDNNYKHPSALVADPKGRYSDRQHMKSWTDEKDRLEKSLPLNMKVAEYKPKIEQMGYKITAVNDREKDYVEYEIVKGENSYEVQIDIDPNSGMARKIDVTSNLWEAEATDKATDKAADKKRK